jgi:hypothetical protein
LKYLNGPEKSPVFGFVNIYILRDILSTFLGYSAFDLKAFVVIAEVDGVAIAVLEANIVIIAIALLFFPVSLLSGHLGLFFVDRLFYWFGGRGWDLGLRLVGDYSGFAAWCFLFFKN